MDVAQIDEALARLQECRAEHHGPVTDECCEKRMNELLDLRAALVEE